VQHPKGQLMPTKRWLEVKYPLDVTPWGAMGTTGCGFHHISPLWGMLVNGDYVPMMRHTLDMSETLMHSCCCDTSTTCHCLRPCTLDVTNLGVSAHMHA
jgi:hypothetical protein